MFEELVNWFNQWTIDNYMVYKDNQNNSHMSCGKYSNSCGKFFN